MKKIVTRLILSAAVGMGSTAYAASWPERPITMVVPFPAGGPTDLIARVIAKQLSEQMGQSVIVENKGGANATIGMAYVANAKPDGYTLLYNTSSIALNPHLYSNLNFDALKDFTGISSTAVVPLVVLSHPSIPSQSLSHFVAHAQKHPNQLSYASAGAGNITHLAALLFNDANNIQAMHIPYRGSAPGLTDLVSGQVQYMLNTINDSLPFIRSGRVNALAVTSSHRSQLTPELPTLQEAGMTNFDIGAWQGIVVPTGTPTDIIERLNKELLGALKNTNVQQQLAAQGAQVLGSSPAQYNAYLQEETQRWGKVIAEANVTLN